MRDPDPSEFTSLRVASARDVARHVRAFELVHPEGAELPAFTPGAHLGVRTPNGMVRRYSLCNDPAQRERYEIAVKREDAGRGGSISMTDELRAGDALAVTAPRNDFPLSERAREHVFIAGGIGITPIMAMVRHLQASGEAKYKLYYLTRSRADAPFADELSAAEYRGRVVIHHDGGEPDRALDLWPILERPTGAHVYCCGPRGLLEAVRDMTGHWSSSAVHFESFLDASATRKPDDRAFRVRCAQSGRTIEVGADQSILDALRADGLDAPSSCESGTCGSCRTRLLAGDVDHRDFVLTEDEHATDIMVCVSRARGDEIEIDR